MVFLNLDEGVKKAMLALVKSDIPPSSLLWLSQFIRNREERAIYLACVRSRLADGSRNERALARLLPYLPRLTILEYGLRLAKVTVRRVQQRLWEARLPASARALNKGPADTRG